jgi:hypothetical protein
MKPNDKKLLAMLPKLKPGRVDLLLEDVPGCRWTVSVLRAVARGVTRPGALERHVEGISAKVLADLLKKIHLGWTVRTRSVPGDSPAGGISPDSHREKISPPAQGSRKSPGRAG